MQNSRSGDQGFYETLFGRRDVRSEFIETAVPEDVLARIIIAAHHAPSVGLSQPWNFIVIEGHDTRERIYQAFCEANEEAAELFEGKRRDHYRQLKLQGILDAPVNLCITCDRGRGGDAVLGRTHQSEMDIYSTVCAVQNLWLAARAEGVGVGWVSIISSQNLRHILNLPEQVVPIAYLCLGYVEYFRDKPELEDRGWGHRLSAEELVFNERWGERTKTHPLHRAIAVQRDWAGRVMGKNSKEPD